MKKLLLSLAIGIFLGVGFFGRGVILGVLEYMGTNKDKIDVIANAAQIVSFIMPILIAVVGVFFPKKPLNDSSEPPTRPTNVTAIDSSVRKDVNIQTGSGVVINIDQGNKDADSADMSPYLLTGLDQGKQEKLQAWIRKYLNWMSSYYSQIEFRGIKRGNVQVLGLDIEKVYYPLYADLIPYSDKSVFEKPISDSLSKILKWGRNIVVTGASGCGKTTVLQYIAYILSKAILVSSSGWETKKLDSPFRNTKEIPIPFILPLSSYGKFVQKTRETTQPPNERTLPYFIYDHLIEHHVDFNIPQDIFWKLMDDGPVILLLDGLDEIPDENIRTQVIEDIEQLSAARENLRIVVTCRSAAYMDRTTIGKGFREVRIKPLLMADVRRIIELAYGIIYENAGLAEEKVNDLLKGIENLESDRRRFNDAKEFVSSPLIVRLLIILHYSEMHLPEQRAKLYMQATDRLLYPDYSLTQSSFADNWTTHRDMLQHLAFHMHSKGQQQGKEISRDELKKILVDTQSYDLRDIEELIKLITLRSSVIEEHNGAYRFIHMGFQEYLTARYLAEIMMSEKAIDGVASFLEENVMQSWWREPILLLMGYLSCDKSIAVAVRFINRFAGLGGYEEVKKQLHADVQLASIEVSIASLLEWPEASNSIRRALNVRLAKILKNVELMNATRSYFKLEFGRSLGRLGDPRFNAKLYYLPKTYLAGFVKIPAGIFKMGSNPIHDRDTILEEETPSCEVDLDYSFYISKYPVTVDQFHAFIKDSNDFAPREIGCVRDQIGNHPVVNVGWDECWAYCNWLTKKLRDSAKKYLTSSRSQEESEFWQGLADGVLDVKLPSEAEWEKAARGDDGRIYPWGNKLVIENANWGGDHSRKVMAVGLYPSGASPFGLLDMSGNVWEWTRSAFGRYPYRPATVEDLSLVGEKVIRGGSYFFFPSRCRCATRYRVHPGKVLHDIGFRIIISKAKNASD